MSMDEFLALPEEKPYREYLRGEVSKKSMPTELHGAVVMELGGRLRDHFKKTREGFVATEVRHSSADVDWVYLPDLNIRLWRTPGDSPQAREAVATAPEFAVEVLSPGDRVAAWLERVQLYMQAGTLLLWVIDPEQRTILAYRPGEAARVSRAGDRVEAEPVLHGFSLDVAEFFASLTSP